jgi:predicted enzyme related to lactoylglutathione lyase
MRHAISWFELPVTDLDRAATFYGAILGSKLGEVTRAEDRLYVMFPAEEGVGGAWFKGRATCPARTAVCPS